MKRALYGHPDSGGHWENHCDKQLREIGYEPIEGWGSCYWNALDELFLVVYVDDFKLAGPEEKLAGAWAKNKSKIMLDEVTPVGLFQDATTSKK